MRRQTILVLGAVLVVALGGGLAYAFGPAVLPGSVGGDDPGATGDGAGTTSGPGGGGGNGTDGGTNGGNGTDGGEPTPTVDQFTFSILQVEECGQTCRDVTVRLTNAGNDTATNVSVVTRIYTGGDQIWEGSERVGTLAAGESHTATKRVNLGYWEAIKVKNNDGHITIVTTVHSSEGTFTFTQERDVA